MRTTKVHGQHHGGVTGRFRAGNKLYFDHMMRSMMNGPLPDADEEQIVATIHAAATHPSTRRRHLTGPDAEEMARLRWSASEDEYLSTMNRLMGQTAWRDGNPG
ncbi:hypothetical protein C1D09_005675 [Mesorhizobium intechi]|uniref:hypothetical protein n=1 Tax=Mesorhizobium intechi TaxID=537601 RepID=UPI000CAAC192|nr:hypothetical protein [Mesorhizobium intechi]TSE13026.1 hypothetical protein C1D09_005675 [Mesorhizobium intechi]